MKWKILFNIEVLIKCLFSSLHIENSFSIFVKSIFCAVLLSILICAKWHSGWWVMVDLRCFKISFNLLSDLSQLAVDVQMVNMSCRANLRFGKVSLPYSVINFSKSSGDDTKTLDRTLINDVASVISNRRLFPSSSEYWSAK